MEQDDLHSAASPGGVNSSVSWVKYLKFPDGSLKIVDASYFKLALQKSNNAFQRLMHRVDDEKEWACQNHTTDEQTLRNPVGTQTYTLEEILAELKD